MFLEAMASGLPIVATTSAAIPEVVPDGRAGMLVPPSDPDAIADALIELLQRPVLRREYAAFGQEYVKQFDWQRIAERFLEATFDDS